MTQTEKTILTHLTKDVLGFTYFNDSIFKSRAQGQRYLNAMAKKGLLVKAGEGFHPTFTISELGIERLAA
jgi:hypothetical protein